MEGVELVWYAVIGNFLVKELLYDAAILPAIGLALSMAYPNAAVGQNAQTLTTYDVVNPPPCTNNKGETVRFIESSRG
ncbi:MAG: hypothetical protein O7A66_03915, partial [Alphaproteobacteria bacterium]|nr:hypothetical protein [Alphaproteobacteria bacterium]